MSSPTPSQEAVIKYPYIPNSTLKVIAGPGSGKTYTLLSKVCELICTGAVRPEEILIVSLTNKAVDNIIFNLLDMFDSSANEISTESIEEIVSQIGIYTIHGLANRVVIENEGLVSVIEETGWRGLLKLLPSDFRRRHTSSRSATTITPKEFERMFKEYLVKKRPTDKDDTLERILDIMKQSKVVTNEDLILKASKYLESFSTSQYMEEKQFTDMLLNRYKIIMIDEFQDLFPSLLPLLKTIIGGKQLIMFGDPQQSVYEFLGDNKEVLRALDDLRPPKDIITMQLRDNFRCTPEITKATNLVIGNNTSHPADSDADSVIKPSCMVYPCFVEIADPILELEYLIDQICQLVCSSARLSDIAVLTRTNAQLATVTKHLQSYGIPTTKLTTQPDWMNDKNIKILIDLLKVYTFVFRESSQFHGPVINERNQSDFSVILTLGAVHGIGNQSIQSLFIAANKRKVSLWDYITQIDETKWPPGIVNKAKIKNYTKTLSPLIAKGTLHQISRPVDVLAAITMIAARLGIHLNDVKTSNQLKEYKIHLIEMLKTLKLCTINKPDDVSLVEWFLETYFDQSMILHHNQPGGAANDHFLGSVNISTIHSSKGLEFPIVFLMGGYNSFPIETNVLYVGMTRARNLLYLSNVNNGKLNSMMSKKPFSPLKNEEFWKYYNTDLKRPFVPDLKTTMLNYNKLQRKYGIFTSSRTYSTRARLMLKMSKYIAK